MVASPWLLAALVLVAAATLTWIHRRSVAAVKRDRLALFEDAQHVLDEHELVERGMDFPVLRGTFADHSVRIEPVVDTLSLRLAPVLRLVVTMRASLPGQPAVSVLQDETGQEFFSGHRDLIRVRDAGWPVDISVASATPDIDREVLERLMAAVSADPAIKQVRVSEHAARCVVRAGQGDLMTYRTTRRANLVGARVSPDVLLLALRTVVSVGERTDTEATVRVTPS